MISTIPNFKSPAQIPSFLHGKIGKPSVFGGFFVMGHPYGRRTPESKFLGKTFNYLTVLREVDPINYIRRVEAVCKCGKIGIYNLQSLRVGRPISCGCYANELRKIKTKNNPVTKRLRKAYYAMLRRCYDDNSIGYERYGGRGIIVCDEWKNSCYPFYDWAIKNGYNDELTLERIDNDGNYQPSNCRWATVIEQARNRRSNIVLSYNGITKTAVEWADDLGISAFLLYKRKRRGWNDEEALTIPSGSVKKLKKKDIQ